MTETNRQDEHSGSPALFAAVLGCKMDDIRDIEQRMNCWIRDFGHEKQPNFISDLKILLHELERLRSEIESRDNTAWEKSE